MKHSVTLLLCSLSALPLLGRATPSSHAHELPASEAPLAPTIDTAQLQRVPNHLLLTGTLKAHRESAVAADTTGKVLSVAVDRGSSVAPGDVLVQIDRRQAQLAAAEAGTGVAAARTRSTLAQTECERAQRLFSSRVISQAEYDSAQAHCDDAAIAVETAGVRSELASKTLGDLAIRAPFAGVVAEKLVSAGESVRPDTRVATLVQLDPLRLELAVPEAVIESCSKGAEVSFRVAAFGDEVFTGRVEYVGATVRPNSRDLIVEALVANPAQRLRPGMFAVAEVLTGDELLPLVPSSAVRSEADLGTDRLFVVNDGKLEERLVQLGPLSGGGVAIRAGLRAGERYVVTQSPELADGLRVQ